MSEREGENVIMAMIKKSVSFGAGAAATNDISDLIRAGWGAFATVQIFTGQFCVWPLLLTSPSWHEYVQRVSVAHDGHNLRQRAEKRISINVIRLIC